MSCSCACDCSCALAASVACANAVNTKLGVWPYRLFLVRRQWTGGEPGRGTSTETRLELGCDGYKAEPGDCVSRPDVRMGTSTRRAPEGTVATDTIDVEFLDGRYTEHVLAPIADHVVGEEIFYEVVAARQYGEPNASVVRCTIVGRPVLTNSALNWSMRLRIQQPSTSFGGASP